MQSISSTISCSGLPICVSGITTPLNHALSKQMMADHDRRREVMKERRSEATGGAWSARRRRDHDAGAYRSCFEEVIEEFLLMQEDGDRDLVAAILLVLPDLIWCHSASDVSRAAKAA